MKHLFTKKTFFRITVLLVAILMLLSSIGCGEPEYTTSIVYEDEWVDGENGNSDKNSKNSNTDVSTPKSTHKGGNIVVDNIGKDKNANYKAKGTVTVSIDTSRSTDYEALFDTFKTLYPDVEIKFDYFMADHKDGDAAEYLSTRAASNKLPDVVFDEPGRLPVYASQGWMYPLDKFVKNDSEFKDIPQNIIDTYTFNGKLYALPNQANFEMIMINKDIMNELNLKMPSLTWSMSDYENLLKAGTTTKYSGIEELFGMPARLCGSFDPTVNYYGYNIKKRQFSMSNSFSKALTFCRNLRAVAGVEAWWMRASGGSLADSDYAKKFGTSDLNNTWMALFSGKILTNYVGSWQASSYKQSVKFDWVMWPYPQVAGSVGHMPVHIDHSFMTSSCKNPEVAFQLLRFVTYSSEGNIARLSMYDKKNKGKYALNNSLYYPVTKNKKVADKFYSLPSVTEVDRYMFDNLSNCSRADCFKFVPNFEKIHTQYISPMEDKVMDGVATADEVMPEAENKANKAMSEAWSTFEKKMQKIQAEFDAKH